MTNYQTSMLRPSIALLFLFLFTSAKAQEIQQFLNTVQDYYGNNPQEKIYLHTDKPSYAAGEDIFFKSYATIGVNNHFSSLSGVLYTELISPANEIVQRATISTPMGVGIGHLSLPDTITEGLYRIRAYTNWMKNSGAEYFFTKQIPVFNGRTDNVGSQTSYEKRTNDVLYKISLNSVSGLPIAKKKVSYVILEGEKIVEKRSVTSSENGQIEIPVNNKYNLPVIKLRFESGDKKMVNKLIPTIDSKQLAVTNIFAEGGKLIKGRINTIAAKSVNSQGLGEKAEITLIQGADTLGVLNSNDLGMGAISVFLNDTTSIKATALYADGTKSVIPPPKIYNSGFSILVNNLNENKIFAQLTASADLLDNSDIYFIMHHMGQVLFVSKSKLNKEELVFSVDRTKIPSGVVTVSILNKDFQPIIERPIFQLNKQDRANNKVAVNRTIFKTREKVTVDLEIGSENDSMRFGAYSASVIDLGRVNVSYTNQANILSSLLLCNDVKGYIENPNYYFNPDGTVKVVDLDFLMLTQGWRNIDLKALNNSPAQYQPEKSLKISGYTRKIGRSKVEPNAKLQLISTKNYFDFLDTTSNADGYFEFNNLMFPDSIKFIISAKDGNKGKNNIDIEYEGDRGFPIEGKLLHHEKWWDINSKYIENLKASKEFFAELERLGMKEQAVMIEEVVVTRKQNKAPEYSSNLNGPGNADQVISAEDLATCATLEMCLAGRLIGVYFQDGVPYTTRGNQPMQVVLDGMYIEAENISMINITDVESIEVLRNSNYTAIYGSNGANGLIVITSKRGSSAMNNYVPKGILTIQPQGFQLIKDFYKPAYDVSEALKYNTDLRSTIHWEPAIVTNDQGKAKFEFFTSDSKGKYLLIIEGIDLAGRILRREMELVVE